MKRTLTWLLTIAIALLPALAGASDAPAQAPPSKPAPTGTAPAAAPSIVIDESTFDFGTADEGSVVTHEFKVRNTGSSVLTIDQVRPG